MYYNWLIVTNVQKKCCSFAVQNSGKGQEFQKLRNVCDTIADEDKLWVTSVYNGKNSA